jgi:hypothetical protein
MNISILTFLNNHSSQMLKLPHGDPEPDRPLIYCNPSHNVHSMFLNIYLLVAFSRSLELAYPSPASPS